MFYSISPWNANILLGWGEGDECDVEHDKGKKNRKSHLEQFRVPKTEENWNSYYF